MSYAVPRNEETLEDQRLYTRARLVEVACQTCAARVLVKKNSDHQTSIQWSGSAVSECVEFARLAASPGGRKVHAHCPHLAASIDQSVKDGNVSIGAEDGY